MKAGHEDSQDYWDNNDNSPNKKMIIRVKEAREKQLSVTMDIVIVAGAVMMDIDFVMIVTDGVEGVCVDPGEMEAILEAGGVRGPGPPGGEKSRQLASDSKEDRHYKMPQNGGDGLATTPSHVYAQSMYHCALCINYHINNHNRNHALLYYLFQENKSFGSLKKTFAFILWCTRSCVKHNDDCHEQ
jgi:hypothetical protein